MFFSSIINTQLAVMESCSLFGHNVSDRPSTLMKIVGFDVCCNTDVMCKSLKCTKEFQAKLQKSSTMWSYHIIMIKRFGHVLIKVTFQCVDLRTSNCW